MYKKIFNIILFLTILFSGTNIAKAADFPDVPSDHPNFKAISYLKEEGVVKGFSDGTYDPWRDLTRCEFLKIVMEASNIEPSSSTIQVFSDLPVSSWCHGYAAEAKEIGVVQGDESGLFWPQRSISRIEALKLLYLLRGEDVGSIDKSSYFDVPVESWYAPYIARSTYSNIIAGKSPGVFGVSDSVNRGEMAEMMYRLVALEANNETVFNYNLSAPIGYLSESNNNSETEEENTAEVEITTSPLQVVANSPASISGEIDKDFYERIELDNPIPRTFVFNEVYSFTGKVTSSSTENVMVVLTNNDTDEQLSYPGTVNADRTFAIDVDFNIGGDFSLGILPSLSGEFKVKDISIVSERKKSTSGPVSKATNLLTEVNNDGDTVFSWNNRGYELSKIVVKQGNNSIVKIISNGKNNWTPNYIDFEDFEEDTFGWAIFIADSSDNYAHSRTTDWSDASETIVSTATTHHFFSYDEENIEIDKIDLEANVGKTFRISGNSTVDIKPDIAITMTDGFVEEFPLDTNKTGTDSVITGPVDFSFSMPIYKEGIYFVEVNNSGGSALYNAPLYVGDMVPLLPDFRDKESEIPFVTRSEVETKLETLRNELLSLLNADRKDHGLNPVILDDSLNEFAQSHSDDMAENNYFSHSDRFGNGPSVRKLSFDIGTPVGENIAKARSLIAIESGLMRSSIHRATILRDYWERVGLGISMGDDDHLVVVQEFSQYPYDAEDVVTIRDSIYEYLSSERLNLGLDQLEKNSLAQDIALAWSESMLADDFFAFVNPGTQESLQENIQNSGFNKSFSSLILSGGDLETLLDNLEDKKNSDGDAIYTDDRWSDVGVGIAASDNGTELNATLIFLET